MCRTAMDSPPLWTPCIFWRSNGTLSKDHSTISSRNSLDCSEALNMNLLYFLLEGGANERTEHENENFYIIIPLFSSTSENFPLFEKLLESRNTRQIKKRTTPLPFFIVLFSFYKLLLLLLLSSSLLQKKSLSRPLPTQISNMNIFIWMGVVCCHHLSCSQPAKHPDE